MQSATLDPSQFPLRAAMARFRPAFVTVGLLSAVLNVLLLGGSIYMMLVYDSVLPSHSIPTLIGLLAMVATVYVFQGIFDAMRTRILNAVSNALDLELSPRIQRAIFDAKQRGIELPGDGLMLMRDWDQVRTFMGGPGPGAMIDLPWILFFLVILTLLHVWLGVTALIGAIALVALTVMTDRRTKAATARSAQIATYRNGLAESMLRHSEVLGALGMRERVQKRWEQANSAFRANQADLTGTIGFYGGLSKVARLFLQSLILSVGAWLVIDGKASGGVIFASSILSGRALAPVDAAISNWRSFAAARLGWKRVNALLRQSPEAPDVTTLLPRPVGDLTVQGLVVAPPGTQRITVNGAGFKLNAGEAVGIIGPSAAGKTSLARALVGIWPPARGSVRLDGAAIDQWPGDLLGEHIGYLPQTVELLDGTVADNIARFDPSPDSEAVIAAARAADVHQMIVQLPKGYDTPVGADGGELSAGQRQRIGLARALYGNPFLVVLDEPNSNLDAAGETALQHAVAGIRERGGIAVVIAHRPSALSHVSHVLFMQNGRVEMFGPRDQVLAQISGKPSTPRKIDRANDEDGRAPVAAAE